jgi:hypothetical protein
VLAGGRCGMRNETICRHGCETISAYVKGNVDRRRHGYVKSVRIAVKPR